MAAAKATNAPAAIADPIGVGADEDGSAEGGPVSSFQSLQAEGDLLAKQGDLRKAIEAYSKVNGFLENTHFCIPHPPTFQCVGSDHPTSGQELPGFSRQVLSAAGRPQVGPG